ncbi:MAG: small subunit ribosomal protein S20 [Flavobacteriaceae bacterium]|jgi:small subunit ribosomal protein S20
MPNLTQAKKALRASEKKRLFNDRRRRAMRRAVKTVETFVTDKSFKDAKESLSLAYKAIDKAVKGGVIKKNTAARKKSRLSRISKEVVEAK